MSLEDMESCTVTENEFKSGRGYARSVWCT